MKILLNNPILLVIMFLTSFAQLTAQSDSAAVKATLHAIAKYTETGTHLRWGYGDADGWYENFREGILVERRRVSPNPTAYQAIHIAQILPETELEALATQTGDQMVSLVLSMAYQNWEDSQYDGNDEDFMDKRANFENRYAFFHYAADQSRTAAVAAGLGFHDTDVEPDVTYSYRLSFQKNKTVAAIKVVSPVVRKSRPLVFDVIEEEGTVNLRWERDLHNRYFSSYWIERADMDQENWRKLTEVPYVQGYDPENLGEEGPKFFSFRDSVENDQRVRYRLIGIDPFGDESPPSPLVYGQGRDRTPPPAPVLLADNTKLLHLQKELSWNQPEGEAVVAYHLQRSYNGKKNVELNFAAPGDTFKLDSLEEEGIYRYQLIAQDAAGNLAFSTEVITKVFDREKPSMPEGLVAETDTSGIITLTWDAPKEKDVIGYYVYAADGEGRAFRRLTNRAWPLRRFVDTVSTKLLNQHRYYYVTAIDKDILYSPASDTLQVIRPDGMPPAPAHVSDFRVLDEGVRLSFRHSHSRDVVKHQLLRRSRTQEELEVIQEWEKPPFNYLDTTVLAEETYFYAYRGVDASGLMGEVVSQVQAVAKRKELSPPELQAENEEGRVVLSWPVRDEAFAWQLYRSVNGGPEQRVSTLTADQLEYVDGRIKAGQTIAYRLRLLRADGRRSPFSQPVEINR
ncbi:MAG: hypothetical protein AAGA62_00460 [Bacteroidota bacterium]